MTYRDQPEAAAAFHGFLADVKERRGAQEFEDRVGERGQVNLTYDARKRQVRILDGKIEFLSADCEQLVAGCVPGQPFGGRFPSVTSIRHKYRQTRPQISTLSAWPLSVMMWKFAKQQKNSTSLNNNPINPSAGTPTNGALPTVPNKT